MTQEVLSNAILKNGPEKSGHHGNLLHSFILCEKKFSENFPYILSKQNFSLNVGGDVRNQNWFTFTTHSIEYALQYRIIVNTKENPIASV